jgi:hypothetical protein
MIGKDSGDFKDLSTREDTANMIYCAVLCSGCGDTYVDFEGKCMSLYCSKSHGKKLYKTGRLNETTRERPALEGD